MQKLIHRELTLIVILFFLETLAGGALFFLMDNNYFTDYINEIVSGALFVIILINLIAIVIAINRISKAKNRTDISSLSVIGNDIQEAYDFAKVGLIVTDDNNEVIWVNKWFSNIESKLIDHQLFDLEPKLKDLKDLSINEMKIEINDCYYQVRYLPQANLYIFKDISDTEELIKYSVDHAPAVGIIAIDNYQDLANILDELSINDNLALIQRIIIDFAKKYNLLIKKYKTDAYLFICNRSDYERMINDRLPILQNVRNGGDEDNQLTLSIGLSSGIDNYSRLFEYASTALDVALSRGGNQAVISSYGESLRFIGGQTEAKEQKNSVRPRSMSNTLKALISEASSIYIMGHATADLDAIGASLGMYCFAQIITKKVKIVYDEFNLENKTRKAFKRMFTKEQINEMTITPTKAIDEFNSKSLLILVDVHNPYNTMSPSLVKKAEKVAVIDHHRRGEHYVERTVLNYIEPSASSASELVAEMIRYSSVPIDVPSSIATFMLAGIILDTNYYRNKIGARTYDASYILKNYGADNGVADSFLKEEYEEYALKTKIMSNSITPYYGVIVSVADQKDIVEQAMLARVAIETLQIAGINACFVIGRISEKDIGISSRSDGTISCQILCEKLGGGGSFTAAAAKFTNTSLDEVVNKVKSVLDQYLNDAREKKVGE